MPNMLEAAVAVVAGGARGIGRASALRLAELGATVAVVDVNLDAAAEYGEQLTAASVEAELRDRAGRGLGIQADLTDPQAAAQAIRNVLDREQRLDIRTSRLVTQQSAVVNNADAAKSIPLRRQGDPSDIADAVQYLTTPLSSYVTGQVLAVDGGATMH